MPGESSSETENPYGRMHVTEPVRATIPVQNGARLSWDPGKFEFILAITTSWSCNSDSLANFTMPTDFYSFACTPEAACGFNPIPRVNGSVTLDRLSRASHHKHAEGVCTALYMNAIGRSQAANSLLAERGCTASYVKLNLAAFTRTTGKGVQSPAYVNNHSFCLKTRPQSY